MNMALAERIANAVLYEGYMLYPYRPSSVKNRQRWTFGGVYPAAYSQAQGGADACTVQTECVVLGDGGHGGKDGPQLDVSVRFLHLLAREVGELHTPVAEIAEGVEPAFRVIDSLWSGGKLYQAWQEAVEREVSVAGLKLSEIANQPKWIPFAFPAWRKLEPIHSPTGEIIAVIVRTHYPITGAVDIAAEEVGQEAFKVTVRVLNLSRWEQPVDPHPPAPGARTERDEALIGALVSTHAILGLHGGEFVSLFDPAEAWRDAVAECRNVGTWPVLVGEDGERDLLLSSPIILYDYPEIAPESPGDLFDGTEIDEILTLRILTMTEEEKSEMRAVDDRARALLERTESLSGDQLMRLHGVMRNPRLPDAAVRSYTQEER